MHSYTLQEMSKVQLYQLLVDNFISSYDALHLSNAIYYCTKCTHEAFVERDDSHISSSLYRSYEKY